MTKHDILLDVQHLSHVFPLTKQVSVKALDDISFQIHRGEIFGLVGESGSGKSTAARCAMGILQPSSGAYSIGQQNNIADRAAHLILPLAVVVLGHLWYYAYMIRNRLLDEMRADYVLLAKAKGLTRRAVMLRHCLRNTMPTYLSIMAISVPHVLGGTYIVETVFSYPGLGTLAYESARYKDYNLLMLLSLLSGALVILCSIIAQTINEQIDPRIRAEQAVRETEAQP